MPQDPLEDPSSRPLIQKPEPPEPGEGTNGFPKPEPPEAGEALKKAQEGGLGSPNGA